MNPSTPADSRFRTWSKGQRRSAPLAPTRRTFQIPANKHQVNSATVQLKAALVEHYLRHHYPPSVAIDGFRQGFALFMEKHWPDLHVAPVSATESGQRQEGIGPENADS
jgi:hypothetical protein